MVSQIIRKIFGGMSGAPQEEKLPEWYKRQMAGYRAAQKKQGVDMVGPTYKEFKSWAEEFDTACMEQKKMIACKLFKCIEVGRGYKGSVELNMTYQQFCTEWGGEGFEIPAAI